jgi:hypothetical protein
MKIIIHDALAARPAEDSHGLITTLLAHSSEPHYGHGHHRDRNRLPRLRQQPF